MSKRFWIEVTYVVSMFFVLGAAFYMLAGWWGVLMASAIGFLGFGSIELAMKLITGKTLSNMAYDTFKDKPVKGWVSLFLWSGVFTAMLYLHFFLDIPGRWF